MIRDANSGKKYTLKDLRDMQQQSREDRQRLQEQFAELRADVDDFQRSANEPTMGPLWQAMESQDPLVGPMQRIQRTAERLNETFKGLNLDGTVEFDSRGAASTTLRGGGGGGGGASGGAYGVTAGYPGGGAGGGGGGGGGYRGFGFGGPNTPLPQIPPVMFQRWLAPDPPPSQPPQPKGRFNNLDWE